MTKNILICGVGGQGTLLASKVLGRLLLEQGYDVKVSEVHGMSQRGGSVVTYVRYGDSVASPVIDKGQADYLLAFEILEAARWLEYLRKDGHLVANTQKMDPMSVITGAAEYPKDVAEKIVSTGAHLDTVDALTLALQAGSGKAVNVVLLGRVSRYFDFPEEAWLSALEAVVPAKTIEINRKAFLAGRGEQ